MVEKGNLNIEPKEAVGGGEFFLVGEPIIKKSSKSPISLLTPKGSEFWTITLNEKHFSDYQEEMAIGEEYWDIVQTLRRANISFRFIVAHQDLVDPRMVAAMYSILGVNGVSFPKQVPAQLACYPRDIMLNLGEEVMLNPDANLDPQKKHIKLGIFGESGSALTQGRKILVSDIVGFDPARRKRYEHDFRTLSSQGHAVGTLPAPVSLELAYNRSGSKFHATREFRNCHIDRVAAMIRGKDSLDYLIVDPNYLHGSWKGQNFEPEIAETCKKLNIKLVSFDKRPDDVPYGVNLVQFPNGDVFLSSGTNDLEKTIIDIVGEEKVLTTRKPIIHYPVIRFAGIRCLTAGFPAWFFMRKT